MSDELKPGPPNGGDGNPTAPVDQTTTGAFALNALDAVERDAFEAQLGEHEELREEVTGMTETAALLGLAVEPVEPSAALKASIMAQLASTPQLPRDVAPVRSISPGTRAADTVAPPTDLPAERRAAARWFQRPIAALTAVAAAVALIIGGGVVAGSIGNTRIQQQQADQLAAINSAEDSQRAVVALDGGGSATLVWSVELASSALIVDGLPALPSDEVYQLWYIDESGARSAGTFSVDGESSWHVLEGDLERGDVIGVTVEPRGGSKAPTTDPVIVIESA